jgi:ADP-heptose:LPS heptosyltransferase
MGGESERETAARTEAAMCTRPVNLVGELKLREALAMIGHFRLWLGNDTGMLHAAVAQRVPSVGIYGPTKAPRWGYDTPQHRSVVYYPERPVDDERYIRLHGEPGGPGRSRRRWDPLLRGCLDAISVERVVAEARSALEAASSGSTTSPFFSVTSGGRRS